MILVLILICPLIVNSCRLDGRLYGAWKRQRHTASNQKNDMRPPIEYDNLVITTTGVSEYGECYENNGDAYIFGLKRMARPECYRCLTLVLRTPNVIQVAHQQEDLCFASVSEAKKTCFDSTRITPNEGDFWFKSEARTLTPCPLEGKFDVGYNLRGSDLKCDIGTGTTVETCERASQANFKFNNCSFPSFDMSLSCLGSWSGSNNDEFVVFENLESMEFRCGLLNRHKDSTISIGFTIDSSCNQLSPSVHPLETYTFKPVIRNKLFAPCIFPEWLLGQYTTLSISSDLLEYTQRNGDTVPIVSRCVSVTGERIMVYSETKCGDKLGFHCLWFRARSPSLIEFKTTLPQEKHNSTTCEDDSLFADYPWSSSSVRGPTVAPCGIQGQFSTPRDLRHADCYNLTVDCNMNSRFTLTAFHCTSGVVFDSRSYDCLAAWREHGQLFTYAQQRNRQIKANICFISQHKSPRLYITSTGEFCPRDYSFTENSDRTIVLEEQANCSDPLTRTTTGHRTRPAVYNRFNVMSTSTSTMAPITTTTPRWTTFTTPYTTTTTTTVVRTTPLLGNHWNWDESAGNEIEPHGLIDTMNSSTVFHTLLIAFLPLLVALCI